MLRGGCDSFGEHVVVVDEDVVEQLTAEFGEEADRGNGLVDASPAAAGSVEHGPHQRQAGPFAGESADDLHSAAGLTEGALYEVGVPDAAVGLGGERRGGDGVAERGPA